MAELLITSAATSVVHEINTTSGAVRSQNVQQNGLESRTNLVTAGRITDAAVAHFSSNSRAASHGEGRKTDASFGGEPSRGRGGKESISREATKSKVSVKA